MHRSVQTAQTAPPTYDLISSPPRMASQDLGDAILLEAGFWLGWTREVKPLIDPNYWPTATVDGVLWELGSLADVSRTWEDRSNIRGLMYTGAGMAFWFSREEELGDSLIRWCEPQLREFLEQIVDPDLLEEGCVLPVDQKFDSIFDLRASVVTEQLELIGWRIKRSEGETISA